VAIQDTKMHTYLEIIHTMKFEVFIIAFHIVQGSYLYSNLKCFGEGPYLNQIYRIWSSSS
jgi:hypothetical protein